MLLRKWEEIPSEMQTDAVRRYYDILQKKRRSLLRKRAFDVVVAAVMLILLLPLILILAIAIKLDSQGPVFFCQERVTQYNRHFKILKFRTMVQNADKGSLVTTNEDERITRVGRFIRKHRLDEISQLINVLNGDMTFVGTRPEVPKYVAQYTPEMMATLLLPAGITSLASIYYKDEDKLLDAAEDVDRIYVEKVLPEKMKYNLEGTASFSLRSDIRIMFMTFFAMLGKEYRAEQSVQMASESRE